MARIRNSPRHSPLHSGESYESGYQYRPPHRDSFEFGPWRRVVPLGERILPPEVLQHLNDGVLVDGVVYSLWNRQLIVESDRTIVGAYEFGMTQGAMHATFYRDELNGNTLMGYYEFDTIAGVDNLGVLNIGQRVIAAAWQRSVYFTHAGLGSLYRWDTSSHVTVAVPGSPVAEFLFDLNDHIVAILKDGDAYIAKWSVNSNPDDYVGYGAGSTPLSAAIGTVQGVGKMGDTALIIGTRGAVRMIPTGLAQPSFRFEEAQGIGGTPYKYAVESVEDKVFFVAYNRKLVSYDGTITGVGEGEGRLDEQPTIYYSKRAGLLLVSAPDHGFTLFLNTQTREWVADHDGYWEFIADAPSPNIGLIRAYINTDDGHEQTVLDLDASPHSPPKFNTGVLNFGDELWVSHVDVIRTHANKPEIDLRIVRRLRDGNEITQLVLYNNAFAFQDLETIVRYHVDAPAMQIKLYFGLAITEGSFGLFDLDANGNVPISSTPVTGYYRADLDMAGNAVIAAESVTYIVESFDTNGNAVLVQYNGQLWDKNLGVQKAIVYVRSLSRG